MSRSLAFVLFAALSAALSACAEAPPADDISNGLRVVGRVDRVEDGGVDWVGVHEVQLVDAEGQVSCARTFDVDALETRAAVACPACGLTLDLADATPVSDDCGDRLGELAERLAPPPLLAFVPAGDRVPVQHGRVVGADDPDGPWATWGSGVLESSGLSWRRDGASAPDVPDDVELPDLRPLHGPPVD